MQRYLIYWLAWTAAGLFYFSQDFVLRIYRNDPTPWWKVFSGWMVAIYICAAFTPAILYAGRRWPIEQRHWLRRVALHFGFASIFSVLEILIEGPVLVAIGTFGPMTVSSQLPLLLIYGFHGNIIRYWLVLGIQSAIRYYWQAQERELRSSELAAQLSGAQLSALKMQLQPHFLFNTLSAIMVLVRQQKGAQAEEMLGKLSDLLRRTLEDVEAQEVPLWREIEFLRLYLGIEQVRFQDRLGVRISDNQAISEALVPHMALQPIVENAVRHGLGQTEGAITIEVKAERKQDSLILTVLDDGPGLGGAAVEEGRGIGLSNTRARLERLYGPLSSLGVEDRAGGGVAVTVVLPFHETQLESLCA